MQRTPGKFLAKGSTVFTDTHHVIAHVSGRFHGTYAADEGEKAANAKLMAAAPEMLEILKEYYCSGHVCEDLYLRISDTIRDIDPAFYGEQHIGVEYVS